MNINWYISKQTKRLVASYARAALAACFAVAATGSATKDDYIKAALAAVLPPLIRWINPKDTAFGNGS
ncbi:MAG: toxin [Podoviridae sp. ctDWo9]|nr:MAG: toxin [Podoviridae sp. ctDWo9]